MFCVAKLHFSINVIEEGVIGTHLYAPVLQDVRKLVCQSSDFSLTHTFKECNSVAMWPAKASCNKDDGNVTLDSCPTLLQPLLVADANGITTPRLV